MQAMNTLGSQKRFFKEMNIVVAKKKTPKDQE